VKRCEVDGVEYCVVHGGLLIEGLNEDDRCTYEETESDEPCTATPLFYEVSDVL